MTLLAHARYCDEILARTEQLGALVTSAGLTRRVPTCPDWNLRELVVHVGGAVSSQKSSSPLSPRTSSPPSSGF